MYSVYAGSTCIYDDTSNDKSLRLIAPTLELADSAAGSFKMTVPVTNAGYNLIERLKTYITVKKDGEEMWEGRVIDESIDFWKNRTLTCEGELAYLNDSTQPPAEYHDLTVRGFLETLIQIHNSKVSEERRFIVGAVTVTDPNDSLYRYTNYEKTIECINDKLVSRLGGHLVVRKENGVRYLDYLADKLSTNTQTIEFGTNLLDYTASFDMTEYATVVVPLGARLEESPIAALEAYTTVARVNDGSIYVQNPEAVKSYGWIEKVVRFDRVTEPSNLLRKAKEYLSELQFDRMVLEVKAVDLHYMNPDIEGVKLSDEIRVISSPHGLNRVFPVMKLSIPLDQPENTLFTLGSEIKMSLTEANNKTNSDIIQRIESLPTKQTIVADAVSEAHANAEEIMNLATNGFITITQGENGTQELYIANTQDLTTATKWWRWNVNGLAYYDSTKEETSPLIAMTMDGSIVADRITSGVLRADLLDAVRIKASSFILENETDPSEDGDTLEEVFQRFSVSDQQLSSEIGGLTQIAIKSVQVYYALGRSQTEAPDDTYNWSTVAPEWKDDMYMWQKTLTVYADDTDLSPHRTWSEPTCIQGANGSDGDNGYNTAIVYLYKRSSTAPTINWTTSLTYSFSKKSLTSNAPTGWYKAISDIPAGTDPLYVTAATAYANTDTDAIAYTEWSTPTILAQNGTNGKNGTNGLNVATVFLYQRATSAPNVPSGNVTYTFSSGAVSGLTNNWVKNIPASNGSPCYVTQATASNTDATDTIESKEWSAPVILVENGTNGSPGAKGVGVTKIVPEYYLSTSSTAQNGGSWVTTPPTWVSGKYIWTRSHVYYDNNTDATTTPVLDTQANQFGRNYTSIKQTVDSIRLSAASGGTPVGTYSGVTETSTVKNFVQQGGANGYYVSTNKGINRSISYGKLTFNFSTTTTVKLKCISYGESNFDYGIISNIDTSLTQTNTVDTANVFHTFQGESSAVPQELSMTIPNGSHYITFKYIKDGSTSSYDDVFKIKAYIGDGDPASSVIQLTGNGIQASSASIDLSGTVTFSDLSGEGSTQINGANIITNTIKLTSIYLNNNGAAEDYEVFRTVLLNTSGKLVISLQLGGLSGRSDTDETWINIYGDVVHFQRALTSGNNYPLTIDPNLYEVYDSGSTRYWWLGNSEHSFSRIYSDKFYFSDTKSYLTTNSSGSALYFYDNNGNRTILN